MNKTLTPEAKNAVLTVAVLAFFASPAFTTPLIFAILGTVTDLHAVIALACGFGVVIPCLMYLSGKKNLDFVSTLSMWDLVCLIVIVIVTICVFVSTDGSSSGILFSYLIYMIALFQIFIHLIASLIVFLYIDDEKVTTSVEKEEQPSQDLVT